MIKKPPVVLEEKVRFARNLKSICLLDQFCLFFSHMRNISQTTFKERSSRMAKTLNGTAMSETWWVVLKKVDHDYPGNSNRFAGFGISRPLRLRCKEPNATVFFPLFYKLSLRSSDTLVIEIQPHIFGKNRAVFEQKTWKLSVFGCVGLEIFSARINSRTITIEWSVEDGKMLIETMIEDMENCFEKTSLYLKTSHSIMNVLR